MLDWVVDRLNLDILSRVYLYSLPKHKQALLLATTVLERTIKKLKRR